MSTLRTAMTGSRALSSRMSRFLPAPSALRTLFRLGLFPRLVTSARIMLAGRVASTSRLSVDLHGISFLCYHPRLIVSEFAPALPQFDEPVASPCQGLARNPAAVSWTVAHRGFPLPTGGESLVPFALQTRAYLQLSARVYKASMYWSPVSPGCCRLVLNLALSYITFLRTAKWSSNFFTTAA